MSNSKRILFYFVHPAKYHLFRVTINHLISKGYDVEIVITGRYILEELVKKEGWNYKIIFPKGRKRKGVHVYTTAFLFLFVTIFKLLKITWGKKYRMFISDDLTTFVGRIRRIPTFFVTDDDLTAVRESVILIWSAHYIFAPDICYMGKYRKKQLGYYGYKSLAHLHPNHFIPDQSKIDKSLLGNKPYFFIRTVFAGSTHDMGKSGINDQLLRRIIEFLEPYGNIVLNSERNIPKDLQKYIFDFDKNDVAQYLAFANIFISDSTTMCAEAAVLGTPSIEIDDWFDDFKQYEELSNKYNLLIGFKPSEEDKIFKWLGKQLNNINLKEDFNKRKSLMLKEKIDVSAFLIWLIENYPQSVKQYFQNRDIQKMVL